MKVALNKLHVGMIIMSNDLMEQIRVKQETDEYLQKEQELKRQGAMSQFSEGMDGILRMNNRVCIE